MEGDSSTTNSSFRCTLDEEEYKNIQNFKHRGFESSNTSELLKKIQDAVTFESNSSGTIDLTNLSTLGNKVNVCTPDFDQTPKNRHPFIKRLPPEIPKTNIKIQNFQNLHKTPPPIPKRFQREHSNSENNIHNLQMSSPNDKIQQISKLNNPEFLKLQTELNETIRKNIAWQKYDFEREQFVRSLFQQIENLKMENFGLQNEIVKKKSEIEMIKNDDGDSEKEKFQEKVITNLNNELKKYQLDMVKNLNDQEELETEYKNLSEQYYILKSKFNSSKVELQQEKDVKVFKTENQKALKLRTKLLNENNSLLESQLQKSKQQIKILDSDKQKLKVKLIDLKHIIDKLQISLQSQKEQYEKLLKSQRLKRQDVYLTPSDVALGPPSKSSPLYKQKISPKHKSRDDKENESTQVQVHFKKVLTPKNDSARSDKSRRKTLNDVPKGKNGSNVCTFCNQSFKDYKKLISHYDDCNSI